MKGRLYQFWAQSDTQKWSYKKTNHTPQKWSYKKKQTIPLWHTIFGFQGLYVDIYGVLWSWLLYKKNACLNYKILVLHVFCVSSFLNNRSSVVFDVELYGETRQNIVKIEKQRCGTIYPDLWWEILNRTWVIFFLYPFCRQEPLRLFKKKKNGKLIQKLSSRKNRFPKK